MTKSQNRFAQCALARLTCLKQKTCTAGEAQLLAFAALDSRHRVLDTKVVDENPESLEYEAATRCLEPKEGSASGF